MRLSNGFVPTLREVPAEAEIASHRLSLRAGLIRKSAAGMYTYLPLGQRVLRKIQEIIRDELDQVGCLELMLPIVQPAELWHESGRWDAYGDEMFRLTDRHERSFCLGPTHEEIITAVVSADIHSYRQLPLTLYQIQNKYRDEIRPRFGVIRGREFIMKDAYSFDRDQAALDRTYKVMYDAYARIFARCGLTTHPVEADPGAIGGNQTHEFMVLANVGEDEVVHCSACGFAANVEKAGCPPTPWPATASEGPLREVATPGVTTIDELTHALNRPAEQMIKTLIYVADGEPVAALLRGDRTLNEIKLARTLGVHHVEAADAETVARVTGAPVGFAGPVGLRGLKIVADQEVEGAVAAVVGANAADTHYVAADWGRDFSVDQVADIRTAQGGDACPECGQALSTANGIEVGQVFKLGTKYSDALRAHFKDEEGKERPFVMGCYGIGVSRTLAAIIEQHHDTAGIRWPAAVAPYHAVIVPIRANDSEQMEAATALYDALWAAGIETVLDDRDERPGVKFNDADLVGYPVRINVGPRGLAEGNVEVRWRRSGGEANVPLNDVVRVVREGLETS